MLFYHLDRSNSLLEGQTIECINSDGYDFFNPYLTKFSQHGKNYFYGQFQLSADSGGFLWEMALDYVRLLKFPNLPSRFQSIFACSDIPDLLRWCFFFPEFRPKSQTLHFAEIESAVYSIHDAAWFTVTSNTDVEIFHYGATSWARFCYFANKYWSGEFTENPLKEVLIPLPCTVSKVLPLTLNLPPVV